MNNQTNESILINLLKQKYKDNIEIIPTIGVIGALDILTAIYKRRWIIPIPTYLPMIKLIARFGAYDLVENDLEIIKNKMQEERFCCCYILYPNPYIINEDKLTKFDNIRYLIKSFTNCIFIIDEQFNDNCSNLIDLLSLDVYIVKSITKELGYIITNVPDRIDPFYCLKPSNRNIIDAIEQLKIYIFQ